MEVASFELLPPLADAELLAVLPLELIVEVEMTSPLTSKKQTHQYTPNHVKIISYIVES